MRILAWESQEFRIGNEKRIDEAGIFACAREIYVFVDENILKSMGDVPVGKAVIINYSMSKSEGILDRCDYRHPSNHIMLFNMYWFDVDFVKGVRKVKEAIFTLTGAFSSSTTNIWCTPEPTAYSIGNSLYNSSVTNDNEVMDYFEDVEINNNLIPEPLYYNIEHMDKLTRNYCALNSNTSLYVYSGDQLIDNRTMISVLDMNKWDTFNTTKMMELNNIRENDDIHSLDSTEITDNLFTASSNSLISGLIYGYDTLTGKVDIVYDKDIPVHVPFFKYQVPKKVENEIKTIQNNILEIGKMVEGEFGNVQILYSPGRAGDRLKTNFRDYNPDNQPSLIDLYADKKHSFDSNINEIVFNIKSTDFD